MTSNNQRRLLLLLKLLYEQTDETHFVSGADILRYWEDAGIRANRKNVYGDVQLLLDAGHDIIRVKSKQNRYFIGSRIFELPELKLLADAVASSHLVTEKKSAALLQKLGRLTSVHNAGHLNRPVYMEGTTKPDNEAIYYAIDAIQTAIHMHWISRYRVFRRWIIRCWIFQHRVFQSRLFSLCCLWPGLGLFVDGINHVGHLAPAVPVLLAGDVPGLFQLPHRCPYGVDAFPVDKGQAFQRIVPIFRQGQHLRKQALGFQGQVFVPQVMVGHHRVAPVFLHTKNCHFVVNSFHLE